MNNSEYLFSIAVLSSLLLMGIILFIILFVIINKQKMIRYHLEMEKADNERNAELLATRIEVHEQTLIHIAQELHDNIGQEVGLVKIMLRDLECNPSGLDETRKVVGESTVILEKISTDMRLVSHSLNAYHIEEIGLILAIERELYYLRAYAKIKTDFEYPEDGLPEMGENTVLLLFRVIQECLQNIVKHAHASETLISIDLSADGNNLEVVIRDNGIGMDTEKTREGMGIANMKERIKILNGCFNIASAPRQGTSCLISLPKENLKQESNE